MAASLPLLEADLAPTFGSAPAGLKPGPTPAGGMRIIHQTGEHDYNEVRKTYQERGLLAEVHAFIDDMPGTLAQADLVISRAGATAVAELAAAGRAALLIPFPGAADQHQLENARAMETGGSCARHRAIGVDAGAAGGGDSRVDGEPRDARKDGSMRAPFGKARRGGAHCGFGGGFGEERSVARTCSLGPRLVPPWARKSRGPEKQVRATLARREFRISIFACSHDGQWTTDICWVRFAKSIS